MNSNGKVWSLLLNELGHLAPEFNFFCCHDNREAHSRNTAIMLQSHEFQMAEVKELCCFLFLRQEKISVGWFGIFICAISGILMMEVCDEISK